MKKVLLVAKFGHDLYYFKKIKDYADVNRKDIKCDIIFRIALLILNIPALLFPLFMLYKSPLSQEESSKALEYEIKRKRLKYKGFKLFILLFFTYFIAKFYAIKFNRILRAEKYDVICLFGGFHVMQRTVLMLAKKFGIRVYHFENGLFPNTTTMDFIGTNFYNSLPREAEFYLNIKESFKGEDYFKKTNITSNNEVEIPQNYIFCPFQERLDTQVVIHSPWIYNMDDFYEVIKILTKNTENDTYFVIKTHPKCKKDYSYLAEKRHPKIIFANNNSTENLIKNAKAILTINSTVGIEGIIFGSKVITLGNAFYSGYGLAKKAQNIEEILLILSDIDNWHIDLKLRDKFLAYIQHYYLIKESWRNPGLDHLNEVCDRLAR